MKDIAVIIPIYKVKEEYLRKCIDSIICQTLSNIQIILVLDGASSAIASICKEYEAKDRRIEMIVQKNMGVSVARNNGIDKCSSKWITFVDADDWVEKDMLEIMLKSANENNADIVITGNYIELSNKQIKNSFYNRDLIIEDKEKLELSMLYRDKKHKNLKINRIGIACAKLYSIKLIKDNSLRYVENLKITEDNIFNMQAFEVAKRIYYVDKLLYHYRKHDMQVTKSYSINVIKRYEDFFEEFEKCMKKYNKDERFEDVLNLKIAISIYSYMKLYIFNVKNDMNYRERIAKVEEITNKKLYANALENVKYNLLTFKQKVYVVLLKAKQYGILYILLKNK